MKPSYKIIFSFLLLLGIAMAFSGCKKNPSSSPSSGAPSITSISPSSGTANTPVSISGSNFIATVAGNTVMFNGVVATVSKATATTISVVAPAGGTTGAVTVTNTNGTATGPVFTYAGPNTPTVTSISPVSGPAGTSVTITGTNFGAVAANNTVKFNGITAAITTASATSIVAVAPAGGSTGAVTVTTTNGTATGPVFTYSAVSGPDIYVVGNSVFGLGYWKNGVFTGAPSDCLALRCIFVSGSDVYIGGADNTYNPKYWKNGVGVSEPVSAGHNGGTINSIFVSGSDVYAAGEDNVNNSHSIPRCWKNGVALPLTYTYGGDSYSVFVSGSDVYLAGSEWSGPSGGNGIAVYWKNGVPTTLTTGTSSSSAQSVYVSGSNVYVAGYGESNYWLNGVSSPLSVPGSYSANGWGVYFTGADVYVVGTYRDLAKSWKNGSMVDLTASVPSGTTYESALSVTGYGQDVYIAGNDVSKGFGYWKNEQFTVISGAQQVYGIVVK